MSEEQTIFPHIYHDPICIVEHYKTRYGITLSKEEIEELCGYYYALVPFISARVLLKHGVPIPEEDLEVL